MSSEREDIATERDRYRIGSPHRSRNDIDASREQGNGPNEIDSESFELQAPALGTNVVEQEDIPPNGGYGWVCTTCVFLINANTWGANSAWGVFLAHYLADSTFAGATQLQYALIGGLSISQSLLVSPLVSACNRKLNTRVSLLIGTVLISIAMLASSFSTNIWHLFLTQGFCFGWGMGFLYITATAALPQWFSSKRSLALGIASSGAGFGGLAYNLGAGAAVESIGLPWTYRLLALCTLAMNLPSSILLKDRDKFVRPRGRTFDYREFGRIQVLLVAFWGFTTELGYITLLYSLPNYAISIGLSARQGSVVGAVLNLGLAVGRPVVGYCSDAFGRINIAGSMTAACGVLCLAVWVPAKTYAVLLVFALTSGAVTGTFWGCVAPVTAEVVGLQSLPSTFSMVCLSLVLPTTFAEPIALQLALTSGYLTSQVYVGCMFLGGALSVWILRTWKLGEIERKAAREQEQSSVSDGVRSRLEHKHWLTPRRLVLLKRV